MVQARKTVIKKYTCPFGFVVVGEEDGRLVFFWTATMTVEPAEGDRTQDQWIARCNCFKICGQGISKDAARESLRRVVQKYLQIYLRKNRLDEIVKPPIWKVEEIGSDMVSFSDCLNEVYRIADQGLVYGLRLNYDSAA